MLNFSNVLALLERHGETCADIAREYGEPGYTDPEKGILFANWNRVPKYIQRGLERRGFELEWSDEWLVMYNGTSKAYRTSPNGWGWTPSFVQLEGFCDSEPVAHDEILEDRGLRADYIEALLNNARAAAFADLDLTAEGFEKYNGQFETGFHPGQNDSPQKVLKHLQETRPSLDVVFQIDNVGQFDCHWSAWTRPADHEEADSDEG